MSGLAGITMTICHWFMTTWTFKITMRLTSSFPCSQDSWSTYDHLYQYLDFVVIIDDHQQPVFVDIKLTKEVMIYTKVRKNCMAGVTPNHKMEANSKNHYVILAAVEIKQGRVNPVESVVLEECLDS